MRRLFVLTLVMQAVLALRAVTVHCEPGKLSSLLGNASVTELTLTGKMDARDFRTLADSQRGLRVLNMHGVQIVAFASDKALFANITQFRDDEVPSFSFASMTQLTHVDFPSQATSIGEGALAACTSLTDVVLPERLKLLGKYAFTGCTALKTIALPTLLVEIGDGAFAQCTSLTNVAMQTRPEPQSGGTASPYQYANCHIATVGARAFAGCNNLTSVNLGKQVKSIGEAAFAGTKLTKADLSAMRNLAELGNWAYAQTPLTSVNLPSQISTLGKGVFLLAPSLTAITLPPHISSVPALALAGNANITEVDLRNLLIDSIGDYALYHLNRLQHMTIPLTTKYVGTRAMAGMTGLQSITTYAQSVPDLGEDVWQDVDQPSVVLRTPGNSVDYYSNAEQWREFDLQSNIKLGDVNGDGMVDIADLNAVINYMLGKVTGTFIFEAGDIDGNGYIDIADVNGVINLMLGALSSGMPSVTPDTGDALVIDNFGITAGERHTIEICLDNCRDYTALQCVVHLPEGLELVEGSIAAGARARAHSVASRTAGNDVAIILYANPNVDLGDNNEDAIVRLTVTATSQLPHQATLIADHVTLVTRDGDSYHAPAASAQVSQSTAIDVVTASADRVYGANGILHIVSQQASSAQLVSLSGMTRSLRVTTGDNTYHNIDPGIYVVRLNGKSHKVRL